MEPRHDVTVLTSSSIRRSKAITCLLFAAILAYFLPQMARHANSIVIGYMCVVSLGVIVLLIGAARSSRAGIYLTDDGVVVRTTFSTRSWRLDELERVESMDMVSRGGPVGIFSLPTSHNEARMQVIPVFRPIGRSPVPVRGLRISVTHLNQANWLDDALKEVNRRIEARRRADGPSGPGRGVARPS